MKKGGHSRCQRHIEVRFCESLIMSLKISATKIKVVVKKLDQIWQHVRIMHFYEFHFESNRVEIT